MKNLLKLSLILLYISCNSQIDKTASAKQWLKTSIENAFATDNDENIYTKEYIEYKEDAINVAYDTDESLSEEGFHNKWKDKFDTKYAGIGAGFMISGQDWSTIKVTECELLSKTENTYTFKTLIEDIGEGFEQKYNRDITVITKGNTFLISDIKEYD